MNPKKQWVAPEVVQFGNIEDITLQSIKAKQPGSLDDFGVTGISDA